MHSFKNDYSEGCHPRILEALIRTNLEQTVGYGVDEHCANAAELIQKAMDCQTADVHFLCGGTQVNLTAIAAFLRPYQCVISADSGHINVHEAGAIEATGHKVASVTAPEGKLTPELICKITQEHVRDPKMIKPGMVYISQSTELGTVYTLAELEAISRCCRELNLYLFMDGARLACALTSPHCDVTLADIPRLCDAFYIGGTKNGMLLGEALVIVNDELKPGFRLVMKQRGGMLAKGRLLGIQFEELFRDGLYFELGRHANRMAAKLQDGLIKLGYPLLCKSPTNQIFPIVTPEQYDLFSRLTLFEFWCDVPNGCKAIRLVTSWATEEKDVDDLLAALQ